MASRAIRKRRGRFPSAPIIDATPERLAKGDDFEFVNPAEIDSSEQAIGLTRRFKSSHFDRLYRAEKLTKAQYAAGEWYRNQWERCRFGTSLISSYGERTSAVPRTCLLALTERQAAARSVFYEARRHINPFMIGYVDRLLLHNQLPPQRNRESQRTITQLGIALNKLAEWLNFG